jgi:hypothetical protein
MKRLCFLWGIGLCLGLAGCAGTQQRVILAPQHPPGPGTLVAHAHRFPPPPCGCVPATVPAPPLILPPPAPALASRLPQPLPAARFLPRFDERDRIRVDPLENPRPDWLGVRTTSVTPAQMRPTLRDEKTERTAAAEPTPPSLPMMTISVPHDTSEGGAMPGPGANPGQEPFAPPAVAETPALAPPGGEGAIPLEYEDDPALLGRPRLSNDGTLIPGPRRGGNPVSYGPEPTYPTAYYAPGTAPTSVPKTREVWSDARPRRPSLLARVLGRVRKAVGGDDAASVPTSTGSEPRDLAQRGR